MTYTTFRPQPTEITWRDELPRPRIALGDGGTLVIERRNGEIVMFACYPDEADVQAVSATSTASVMGGGLGRVYSIDKGEAQRLMDTMGGVAAAVELIYTAEDAIVQRRREQAAEEEAARLRSEERQQRLLAEVAAGEEIFFRFGHLPASGRSYNSRDNFAEAGVCVYRGWLVAENRVIIDFREVDAISGLFIAHGGAPEYIVEGTVVGRCADNAYVLTDCTAQPFDGEWEVL